MNILVIRPGAIGDALLAFPILQALRAKYPGSHITFVSTANVLPLAPAFGVADQMFDYQDVRWSELFSAAGIRTPAMRDLLRETDLAICWLRDPEHLVEHNLRMAGVKESIVAPGRPSEGERIHIVDYLAQTVGLGNGGAQLIAPVRFSHHPAGGPDQSRSYTIAVADRQPIAIHPGSGSAEKCWPVSHFATVIERLWGQQCPVLLLAGPADIERLDDLLRLLATPSQSNMLRLLVNAPLLEVTQQLQQCRCYLGNDCGITHLAALLGVPTIALFGPSDPATWRPIGPSTKVIQEPALTQLPVDLVMQAISSFYTNE